MKSSRARALISALTLVLLAPFATACAGGPPIVDLATACSTMIPSSHRLPVPGAELPAGDLSAGRLAVFADAQTGQLDKANGRTADVLEIVERCESRDRAMMRRLQAPIWKRILGGPRV